MTPPRRELGSFDELTQFLTGSPPDAGVFRDTPFDLVRGEASPGATAAATGEDYLEVWLPDPLGVDLLVRSREEPAPGAPGLEEFYELDATNPEYALRCLAGITATLNGLWGRYDVVMRDRSLSFGPLRYPPAEMAADLVRVIEAVATLAPKVTPPADDATNREPTFCYFCGNALHPGTTVCPSCGERLEND